MSAASNSCPDLGASPQVTQGARRGPSSAKGGTAGRTRALPYSSTRATESKHRRSWTAQDENLLTFWWGTTGIDTIAARLGRTQKACFQRAKRLGLQARRALGTLNQVAVESGLDRETMRRILKRAGVATKRAPRDPGYRSPVGRRGGYRQRLVDRDEARAAVEAYLDGETITAAARRRGRPDDWMKRRLVQAGAYVAEYAHRYSDEAIEAAIAGFRPSGEPVRIESAGRRLTVREWAAATGTKAKTIWSRLRAGWDPARAVTA